MAFTLAKAQRFITEFIPVVHQMTVKSKQLRDLSQYESIRKSIMTLATTCFGLPVEVNFFGSRIIGVGTGESDLDIYVCIDKKVFQMHTQSDEQEQEAMLQKLKEALQASGEWEIKDYALKTASPVLFSKFTPMQLDCQISIINAVATRNSQLLAYLFDIQPEAVSLVHFVKFWLKSRGFDHLKDYTIALLVLFFLQKIKMMPRVKAVQHNVPKEIIDGWEVQYDRSKSLFHYHTRSMINYRHFVRGFFEFYKSFDYSNVMCTHNGRWVSGDSYKARFPNFLLKGILIAGPVNLGINCGIIDDQIKKEFILLCKSSHDFFKNVKSCGGMFWWATTDWPQM